MSTLVAPARQAWRPATFWDVLRSEWTKLRTLRSTLSALGAAVALGVGLGAVISAAASHHYAQATIAERFRWDPTAISLAGLRIAQLAMAILGVLTVTNEYASGLIRTSLTVVPRRGRLLFSKTLVFLLVVLVVGEAISFASFFIGQLLITGYAPHTSIGAPEVLRAVFGAGLYLAALCILGVALGSLLRHTAAGIGTIVALVFILPGIADALPDSWRHPIEKYWPTQAGVQLFRVHQDAFTLSPWWGFGLLCSFVAVLFVAAYLLLERRDS